MQTLGLRRSSAQEAALLYLPPVARKITAIARRVCRRLPLAPVARKIRAIARRACRPLPLRLLFRRVTYGYEIRSWYKRLIW
jgi:hypothetical protein